MNNDNGVIAARSALTDPSPAVAEIDRLVKMGRQAEYDQDAKVPKEA